MSSKVVDAARGRPVRPGPPTGPRPRGWPSAGPSSTDFRSAGFRSDGSQSQSGNGFREMQTATRPSTDKF